MPIPEGIDVDDPESLGQFIGRALRQRRIRTRRAIVGGDPHDAISNFKLKENRGEVGGERDYAMRHLRRIDA